MDIFELKNNFEQIKTEVLGKIRRANEKWRMVFQKAQGDPAAETDLLHLKLELQIAEIQALDDLKRMEEKIKMAEEDDSPAS